MSEIDVGRALARAASDLDIEARELPLAPEWTMVSTDAVNRLRAALDIVPEAWLP